MRSRPRRSAPGIEGIRKEHDEFVAKKSPSQDVVDSFLTGAGSRTEHYEIEAYEENLEQERSALEKLQMIGKRLAQASATQAGARKTTA